MRPVELSRLDWARTRRALSGRSGGGANLALLLLDLALLACVVALCGLGGRTGQLAATPLLSIVFVHAYLMNHECVHNAVFRRDRWNRALGHLLGFVLLYPFSPRRRAHLLHHRWTGDSAGDPANQRAIARFASLSPRAHRVLDLLWRSWCPFLVINERIGLWRSSLSASAPRMEYLASLIYLSLYAALLGSARWLGACDMLLVPYLGALALSLGLEEIINLPHHTETPLVQRSQPISLWQQHAYSHSCRSLPIWSRWLLLNFNLHVAHHMYPQLPWYRLPAAHAELARHQLEAGTEHELAWNLRRRRRPFREVFAAYLR